MKTLLISSAFASVVFFVNAAFSADTVSTAVSKTTVAASKESEAPKLPQGIITNKLVADAPLPSDYVLGNKNATVVMIEYASLSCPHCAHFYSSIMPEIKKKYIDTGKILYILRQYPLNEPALKGAMLVNCVGEQQGMEKYYLFNKVLFDAQSKWAFDGDWQSGLETISAVGGVGKEQFLACINSTERETAVLKDKMAATNELQIPHTPYFFIGGEAYNEDVTLENISKFIDGKLIKK